MMPRYRFPSSTVSILRTGCTTCPSENSARAFSIAGINSSHCSSARTCCSSRDSTTDRPLLRPGWILSCRARCSLPHHRDEAAHLTAVALHDRGEFGALSGHHADAFDDNVGDLVGSVVGYQSPIELHWGSGAWGDHVGRHDDAIPVAAAAADFQCLAAEIRQSRRVHENNIVFEQLHEFLLLLLARGPPITAEYESGDAGTIEIGMEQLAEPRLPHRRVGLVVEHLDGAVPQRVHKGDGIGRIDHWWRCHGCRREQDDNTGQKGTANHVGLTPPSEEAILARSRCSRARD